MGYFLFLLSILIATFYYFRMARRFESFDSEITEELQREMNSLILDFNQTANQNITMLEDSIAEGKTVMQDLATQVNYLKQLRDSLDSEVRELQKSLFMMKEETQHIQVEQKTIVQKTYDQITHDMKSLQAVGIDTQEKKPKRKSSKTTKTSQIEDNLDIDTETLFRSGSQNSRIKPTVVLEKLENQDLELGVFSTKKLKPNIPKTKTKKRSPLKVSSGSVSGKKAQILDYYSQGWEIEKISSIVGVPKGEVDLVIQLFHSQSA